MRPARLDEPIYLDNNATTRVDPEVVAAMLPFFTEHFGNPSSAHGFGGAVAKPVAQARRQVQALLGAAGEQEIVFTASGTEADTTAILAALEAQPGRNEVVTTAVEHPAVLALCRHLEQARGTVVHIVPVDEAGALDLDAYRRALGPRTAVASVMWANNETGVIFPTAELAALAHAAGALFHTDAVQAVGKLPVNVQQAGVDLLSLSGHKLHAPKGIGALYVRRGLRFTPMLRGGGQERGRRAGTENVPGIVGLGRAAALAAARLAPDAASMCVLRDRLEAGLQARIDDLLVLGEAAPRLPNTSCLGFFETDSDGLLILLDRAGIAASSGSACKSGMAGPSHVLRAMRVPAGAAEGAIRLSLSRETTAAEIDRVLATLPALVAQLRARPTRRVPAMAGTAFALPRLRIVMSSFIDRMRRLSAAEEFFTLLGVSYDPQVLQVARLHVLRRMGQYLSDAALEALTDDAAEEACRAALSRAYADFVASTPIAERTFKVHQNADPRAGRGYIPFSAIAGEM